MALLMSIGKLFRYGVKTIDGKKENPDFKKRVAKALLPLLNVVGSDGVVVMEKNETSSSPLTRCLRQILQHSMKDESRLFSISLTEAKQTLCMNPKATHQNLISTVARQYPILGSLIKDASAQKTKYWGKVSIALAFAEVAKERLFADKNKGVGIFYLCNGLKRIQ